MGGGFGGRDTINGASGQDTIYGGPGNDTLNDGYAGDRIFGGSGQDFVDGGFGNNSINVAGDGNFDSNDCGIGTDTAVVGREDLERVTFADFVRATSCENLIVS